MCKPPGKKHQRDRALNDDEIRFVRNPTEQIEPLIAMQLKLLLLTAQRGGEVRTMRWEGVDVASGWWTIPGQITENGLAHRVPLSPPAPEILQTPETIAAEEPWVFPSHRRPGQPVFDVRKAIHRVCMLSGVTCTPHHLRRTAASHMTSLGAARLVVGKILNHVETGVRKVYDLHSYNAEKRQALNARAGRVMELVTAVVRHQTVGITHPLHPTADFPQDLARGLSVAMVQV